MSLRKPDREGLDDLVAAAQSNPDDNSEAMNEIVRRFQPLAKYIAITVTDRTAIHDDLMYAGLMGLVRAVRRHQPNRKGFTSYARRYIEGAARREFRVWVPDVVCESLSEPSTMAEAEAVVAPTFEPGTYTWGYGKAGRIVTMLPERQRSLLTRRYVDDAPLAEIAIENGTTVAAVSQRLGTAHRVIGAKLIA